MLGIIVDMSASANDFTDMVKHILQHVGCANIYGFATHLGAIKFVNGSLTRPNIGRKSNLDNALAIVHKQVDHMIVISDGKFNMGNTSPKHLASYGKITCISPNGSEMMRFIATLSKGTYVETKDEVTAILTFEPMKYAVPFQLDPIMRPCESIESDYILGCKATKC